jgi:twinkle protein
MSDIKFERTHLPCPCGNSSDAYAENADGSGKCFSCDKFFKSDKPVFMSEYTRQFVDWRNVTRYTMQKYGAVTRVSNDGEPFAIEYPYGKEARKVRSIKAKDFMSEGPIKDVPLFGMDVFPAASDKTITITEGELDALSAYQILGTPCVSIKSAGTAGTDCKKAFEYLDSFDKIYLAFDSDEPGKKATATVAAMFNNNKVFIVQMDDKFKDANGYLVGNAEKQFKNAWFYAKRYLPDGIISSFNEIEGILGEEKKQSLASYPFSRMQEMTYGLRGGEVVLIKAPEGIGKTEIIRAIEYGVLKETDHNVGIVHLEENKARTIRGLAGYELDTPVHLPDSVVSPAEVFTAFQKCVGRDERVHIYSHFGSDDPDIILNTIRFLVAVCGCKFIFLDHISILISGLENEDERKRLDYISTKLKMMAEELDFCLVMISHVNDDGKTRGSRNISKIADLVFSLNRNLIADDEVERNTTLLLVEKNRFASSTGPAGKLFFDRETFKIREFNEQLEGIIPKSRA